MSSNKQETVFPDLTFAHLVGLNRAMFPGLPCDVSGQWAPSHGQFFFVPRGTSGVIVQTESTCGRVFCTLKETRYRGYQNAELQGVTFNWGASNGACMALCKQLNGLWQLTLTFHPGDPMEGDLYRWLAFMCWDDPRLRDIAIQVHKAMSISEKKAA